MLPRGELGLTYVAAGVGHPPAQSRSRDVYALAHTGFTGAGLAGRAMRPCGYTSSPAVAGIVGAWRELTALMTSDVSMPWR